MQGAPGSLADVPLTFKHFEFESPNTPNDDEDDEAYERLVYLDSA